MPNLLARQTGRRRGDFKLMREIDRAYSGIVGVDRCEQSAVEHFAQRMTREIGHGACLHIAGQVCFDADPLLDEKIDQRRIFHRTDTVSDPFGAEQSDRVPNAFSAGAFAGVNGDMPARLAPAAKMVREKSRRKICFVAREIERRDFFALSEKRVEFNPGCRSITCTYGRNFSIVVPGNLTPCFLPKSRIVLSRTLPSMCRCKSISGKFGSIIDDFIPHPEIESSVSNTQHSTRSKMSR